MNIRLADSAIAVFYEKFDKPLFDGENFGMRPFVRAFNSINLNKMDKKTSFMQVVSHIYGKGLSREEIIELAQNFPVKTIKNLLQRGVLYEIA